jgi:gluconolactonase
VKLTPDGMRTVFREPSGRANGQVFDRDGVLYHCEGAEFGPHGGRRITRTNLRTGSYEVVTDRYEGARYNSPNDICVDGAGRFYFSDPRYGARDDLELDVEGVYRIDPDGAVARILAQPQIERPNGVAVTQDSRLLYVVDTSNDPGGSRKLWRFELDERGGPHDGRVLHDFAPGRGGDGMELDLDGNLYVAAGIDHPRGPQETADVPAGVYVLSPEGSLLGRIPIPEDPVTNVAFGGADGRTLYVTAGKSIFATRVDVPGQVAYPRWQAA